MPSRVNVSGRRRASRRLRQHLRHRQLLRPRRRRAALELLAGEVLGAELDDRAEVRRRALVLPVVRDERFHRQRVLLRVAPASVLARRHHPAHHLPDGCVVDVRLHERVEHDRRGTDVGVPEPEQIRIAQFLDMRAARFRKDGVGHAATEVGDAAGRIGRRRAARDHRVVEVREREHRHPIAVAVEPREVRVLVAAALDEHLDREGLPGGVGRPPAFVRRRLVGQRLLEVGIGPRAHAAVDLELLVDGGLEHVQQVGGEVRRREVTVAWPVREAAVRALELLEVLQVLLRRRAHLRRVHPRQREGVAEVGGQHQRERARTALLGAAVRILDEIARPFPKPDHRRRRQLDVQAAEAGDDARGNGQRFGCGRVAVGRLTVRRDRFWRDEQLDRDDVLERVASRRRS